MSMSEQEVQAYLDHHKVQSTVEESINACVRANAPDPYAFMAKDLGAKAAELSAASVESVYPSAIHAIHNTPAVELSRLTAALGVEGKIVAKLEYMSPGFSKKDRIARQMLEEALAEGRLKPGQPVVELTSGNTGTGLAICCACLGHPFIAVMSKGNSTERARMMRALGAEVVLVDQCDGSVKGQVSGDDLQKVFEVTDTIVAERGAFRANQFELLANTRAHEQHTGPELLRQAAGSGLAITGFADFVGSGGTYAGIANALRAARGDAVKCYVVEPLGAAVVKAAVDAKAAIAEGRPAPPVEPSKPHKIQGGGCVARAGGHVDLCGARRCSGMATSVPALAGTRWPISPCWDRAPRRPTATLPARRRRRCR